MSGAEILCIFCGKGSEKIAWVENGFVGRRCDCGLIYISPRPGPDEILDLYNSPEADWSAKSRIKAEFAARLNGRHRLRLIKKYLLQGSLLEIGSGGGYFLDESKRAGFEPFGVEPNLLQAKFIREQFKVPVETNPFGENSFTGLDFDMICHFDVLSHFYDPIFEFKNFSKRLKEEGILFFETGNGGDLSQRWLKFIKHLQYPHHLFLFSEKNIEQLCNQTGFEILKKYQYSIFLQLLLVKWGEWLKKSIERFIMKMNVKVFSEDLQEIPQRHSWWKVMFLKTAIFLNFFMRYKIGRIFPRFGPQTIIYIAKRVATVDSN